MRVRYTPDALADLAVILDDISLHSPQGAKRVQARLQAAIDRLLDHPRSGMATDSSPLRRIVTSPYPYLVFYEPGDGEIVIIGVRHAARDPAVMPDQR